MINEQRRRVAPPSGAEADGSGNTTSGDGNRRVSPDGTTSGDGSRRVSPDTPRTTTDPNIFACLLKDTDLKLSADKTYVTYENTNNDGTKTKWTFYTNNRISINGNMGSWSCDGTDNYIIKLDDKSDEYSYKTGWKSRQTNTNNANNTNNTNTTTFIDTNLTGDELKAGKVVKMGMKGPIVGTIQDLLIKLGYTNVSSSGKADSKFGERTKQMVKDFQTNNGLNDDGEVGKNTWPKLNDPNAVGASSSSPSSSAIQATSSSKPDEVAGSDAIIIQEERKKLLRKYLLQFK
jgi:hypothetical protein